MPSPSPFLSPTPSPFSSPPTLVAFAIAIAVASAIFGVCHPHFCCHCRPHCPLCCHCLPLPDTLFAIAIALATLALALFFAIAIALAATVNALFDAIVVPTEITSMDTEDK